MMERESVSEMTVSSGATRAPAALLGFSEQPALAEPLLLGGLRLAGGLQVHVLFAAGVPLLQVRLLALPAWPAYMAHNPR